MSPLTALSAILVLGIGSQWLSWALRLPSILLLLITGLILGPILHVLEPKELFGTLFLPVITLAVGIILFEGGLSLRFKDVKKVRLSITALVTIGLLVGFALVALFLHKFLGYGVGFSLLQSAILTVTGPTVIIPMLGHLRIKEPISSILHWEGIVIDPIGAVLAVLIFEGLLEHATDHRIEFILYNVFAMLVTGVVVGLLGGYLLWKLLKHFMIPDQLHNPVALMLVVFCFTLSNYLQPEAGLICVTVMGVVLANQKSVQVQHIVDFKESIRMILISILFILIASAVNFKDLIAIWDEALYLLLFLILIARPLTAVISTLFSKLNWNEVAFIGALAPRGIVAAAISSLFGLQLLNAGYSDAGQIAPLTFAIIAGTVLIYGFSSPAVARALGVIKPEEQGVLVIGANPLAQEIAKAIKAEGIELKMIDSNYWRFSHSKLKALPVQYGNIFSLDEEEGLVGIGKLLALTDSDNVNSLAALHFNELFGKANLFQLATPTHVSVPQHLRGQILFGEKYTFQYLTKKVGAGWVAKATNLTEEFSFEKWKEHHKEEAIPLFYITKKCTLEPFTTENSPRLAPGGKILFLVQPAIC